MDFILQVEKTAQMFITGPGVIKEVTGEEVTFEELGDPAFTPGNPGWHIWWPKMMPTA
jgi:acetyl-CoA carboxylase carboxyltransferase component